MSHVFSSVKFTPYNKFLYLPSFVRFHAMQSIITFLPLAILTSIFSAMGSAFFFAGGMIFVGISWLLGLVTFILWLILMVKAYKGEMYKLPIAGEIAENQV
ncbi:hypothetical protein AKJ50_00420 [candidate division MSBL1 archaeon SCGC-AAA382A13]|uniref:DUF4870 domain-containing protein n=1 Tax=candidate division MSBL1 archaeon SCGC-AAA382A13 TaxID=1698279 RepID=A0A133VGS4_9EURY|nr:hypothetical protein AKJ50_00420 [candidate division MSBL1 archaeon SCGC-AAA382A13]